MLLEATGISKTYRTRESEVIALDDVSIVVDDGEAVGLIGASGSGKSTMASIVVGLENADAGTLTFLGKSCDASLRISSRPAEFRRALLDLQMVFQHPGSTFSDRMRIGAGVAEGIAYRGVPKEERPRLVAEALEMVGLPASYASKHAWELSGGECQRAAIARAIISRPRLLVCDEPTSALDVTIQAQIIRLLKGLIRDLGMACLFISHDLALVRDVCTRVYVLDTGRLVEQGSADEVLANPRSEAAQALVRSIITL